MLEVKNLKSYALDASSHQIRQIVDDVSFKVEEGKTLGIFGESGSGKSFTAFSILGVLGAYPGIVDGEIWFEADSQRQNLVEGISNVCKITYVSEDKYGKQMVKAVKKDARKWNKEYGYEYRMREIRGKKVALAPQGAKTALWPFGTIRAQIYEACLLGGSDKNAAEVITFGILNMLQLNRDAGKYPHELAGGAGQRAMLGIVLALNPNLLIADEFTTGLDPVLQLEIIRIMQEFNKGSLPLKIDNKKHALIVISHDLKVMRLLVDDIVVMHSGKIVESDSRELLTKNIPLHPYTQKLFEDADIESATIGDGHKSSFLNILPGCRYKSRCCMRQEICNTIVPELLPVEAGSNHKVRCHVIASRQP